MISKFKVQMLFKSWVSIADSEPALKQFCATTHVTETLYFRFTHNIDLGKNHNKKDNSINC